MESHQFKIRDQLEALHDELSILSRKKPDDAINEFKLQFINQVLTETNSILDEKFRPFDGFETFDLDNVPTNSDVVLILAQYLRCLNRQRISSR